MIRDLSYDEDFNMASKEEVALEQLDQVSFISTTKLHLGIAPSTGEC